MGNEEKEASPSNISLVEEMFRLRTEYRKVSDNPLLSPSPAYGEFLIGHLDQIVDITAKAKEILFIKKGDKWLDTWITEDIRDKMLIEAAGQLDAAGNHS